MPIAQKLIDFIQVIVLLATFLILFTYFGDLKEKIGKIIDAVKEFFGRKSKDAKEFFVEKFRVIKEFIFNAKDIIYIVIIVFLLIIPKYYVPKAIPMPFNLLNYNLAVLSFIAPVLLAYLLLLGLLIQIYPEKRRVLIYKGKLWFYYILIILLSFVYFALLY